jgi:hypothetical protein
MKTNQPPSGETGQANFRMLVRNLRLMDEAKEAGKCYACGRKLPKPKLPASPEKGSELK